MSRVVRCGQGPDAAIVLVAWSAAKGAEHTTGSPNAFLPNLRSVRVKDGPNSRKIRICAACLKGGNIVKA